MPFDVLTNADNFRVQGSLTVINDPQGNAGNVNIQGTLTASGSVSAPGSASIGSGLTVVGGASITNGLQYDLVSGASFAPPSTTSSQALASGGTITMTSNLVGHTLYVSCSDTSETTIKLAPTSSTSTSGVFQNGVEITVINLSVSGTNVVIPASSAGAFNHAPYTISGGQRKTFVYDAAIQCWISG